MTGSRPGSGGPPPGPGRVVMAPPFLGRICPHQFRQDSAPECEAGASPHIREGCLVVLLRATHHPAGRKARQHDDRLLCTPRSPAAAPPLGCDKEEDERLSGHPGPGRDRASSAVTTDNAQVYELRHPERIRRWLVSPA